MSELDMPSRSFSEVNLASTACPRCLAIGLQETTLLEQVPLDDDDVDYFEVEVPLLHCAQCDFSFTDSRAEKLRHAAACRHLGLLTPSEIYAIREALDLTRKEFDDAYGIPPASMERWENGRNMQNRSMNTLLLGLQDREIAAKLDQRSKRGEVVEREKLIQKEDNVYRVRFARLAVLKGKQVDQDPLIEARQRASSFRL